MPLDILIGAQWGDEGKGRITDLLAAQAEVVARYSGGDNAGHSVTVSSANPENASAAAAETGARAAASNSAAATC